LVFFLFLLFCFRYLAHKSRPHQQHVKNNKPNERSSSRRWSVCLLLRNVAGVDGVLEISSLSCGIVTVCEQKPTRRRSMHESSACSLLQLAGPSPLLSAVGPPTSLPMPPPPPSFLAPFPPAAAALYQAGLLVNMYAAAAAAFSAASTGGAGAPCPSDMLLSPPLPPSSSVSSAPGLDAGHVASRADPSLIAPGKRPPTAVVTNV